MPEKPVKKRLPLKYIILVSLISAIVIPAAVIYILNAYDPLPDNPDLSYSVNINSFGQTFDYKGYKKSKGDAESRMENNPPAGIQWQKPAPIWHDEQYLYTSDYIISIRANTLCIYDINTGEVKPIYEPKITDGQILMALCASETGLYLSCQHTDMKYWPTNTDEINGTYSFSFETGEWKKLTGKAYRILAQFDEDCLYGFGNYTSALIPDKTDRIKLTE